MAKAAKNKPVDEVLVLEAEEIPLEKQIDNTLVRHNVTEAVINGLKDKYGDLKLSAVDSKEDYLTIKEARNDVRKYGILAEKICKAGRQSAIEIQKLWISKEKQVLGKISEVQDPLEAEIKKYEDEQSRLELEEIRKRENAFAARQSELIKMGAVYMDGFYSLNHVSFESDTIKTADQDIWESSILPKYKAQYQINEAARVEEDRKREEAAASLRAAQEAMAQKEKEMQEREAALQKAENERLAAIRQQQAEEERKEQQRHAEERRLKAEKEERTWRGRLSMIDEVGWNGQYAFPRLGSDETKIFTYDELVHLPDDVFNARLKVANDATAVRKKEIEEKKEADRKEQIRLAEEAAAQRERDRIALEQKQAKEKEEREAAAKAEEALKATDKTKWQAYVAYHAAGVVPDMKSPSFKAKIVEAQKMMQKIINL